MILRIKVKPNAAIDLIEKDAAGQFVIRIKAQPVEGKANKYLVDFLAKQLELPKSFIEVIKGETNAFKTLEIAADEDWVINKLRKLKS